MASQNEMIIKISSDVDQAVKGIKDVNKQIEGLSKSTAKVGANDAGVGKLNASFSKLGKTLLAVGTALATMGVAMKAVDFALLAADAEQADIAFEDIVTNMGKNAEEEFAKIKEASKGLIPEHEIKQAATSALSLGVPLESLAHLMEIARVKAKQMGTDTATAFADLTTGIARGSVEILDNLGITVKAGEAYAAYAETIGKTVTELTAQEKILAITKEVTASTADETERLGDAQLTSAEKVQKMNASLDDMKVLIGDALLPALNDTTEGITNFLESMTPEQINSMQEGIKLLADGFLLLVKAISTVAVGWGELAAVAGVFVNGASDSTAALENMNSALAESASLTGKSVASLREMYEANRNVITSTTELISKLGDYSGTDDLVAQLTGKLDELQDKNAAIIEQMEQQKAIGDPYATMKEGADSAKKSIDGAKKSTEDLKKEAEKPIIYSIDLSPADLAKVQKQYALTKDKIEKDPPKPELEIVTDRAEYNLKLWQQYIETYKLESRLLLDTDLANKEADVFIKSIDQKETAVTLDANTEPGEQSAVAFQDSVDNAPPVYQTVWADMNNAYSAVNDFVSWGNRQSIHIPVSTYSVGGQIQSYASGGQISGAGTGTSDSILARVSAGEYIIKAAAVDNIGVGALDAINNMQLPSFASGSKDTGGSLKDLGSVTFNIGSESFDALMPEKVAKSLQIYLETFEGL